MAIIFTWFIVAMFANQFSLSPNHIELTLILQPPSPQAWLGYDDLGRPIVDRILMGAQTSFIVAFVVVAIAVLVGVAVGLISAYSGGWVDKVVSLITDIFLAFPGILLAIALAGILGPGLNNIVIALCIVGWVGFARLTRAQVLSVKHRDHVQAAVALGTTHIHIMFRHILPLILAPIIVEASFAVASVVIAEAGLSFLGLGIQPPEASWGNMIRDGAQYLLVAPHMVIAPGIILMFVVLAVNMLGDRLRDYMHKSQ
jgi:peptide/nickel transport system permease protein